MHQSAAWYSMACILTFHLLILLVTGMGVSSNTLLPSVLLAADMLSCLFWACPVSLGDVSRCGVAEPEGLSLFTSTGKCCPICGPSPSLITQRRRIPLCLRLCRCSVLSISLIGNLMSIKWSLAFAFWTPVRLIYCSCWLKFPFCESPVYTLCSFAY